MSKTIYASIIRLLDIKKRDKILIRGDKMNEYKTILEILDNIQNAIVTMDDKFNSKFNSLDDKLNSLDNKFNELDNKVNALDNKIDNINSHLQTEIRAVKTHLENVTDRNIQMMLDEYTHYREITIQNNDILNKLDNKVDIIEKVVNSHSNDINRLIR